MPRLQSPGWHCPEGLSRPAGCSALGLASGQPRLGASWTCAEQAGPSAPRGRAGWGAVPEQQGGVGHRQLPTGHVGVGHTALGCPRVTGVSEKGDEAVREDVQLGERVGGWDRQAFTSHLPPDLLLPRRGCDKAPMSQDLVWLQWPRDTCPFNAPWHLQSHRPSLQSGPQWT